MGNAQADLLFKFEHLSDVQVSDVRTPVDKDVDRLSAQRGVHCRPVFELQCV